MSLGASGFLMWEEWVSGSFGLVGEWMGGMWVIQYLYTVSATSIHVKIDYKTT